MIPPSSIASGLTADQLLQLSISGCDGFTLEQLGNLSIPAVSGFRASCIEVINPESFPSVSAQQIAQIPVAAIPGNLSVCPSIYLSIDRG